jgi:hypothetical protein
MKASLELEARNPILLTTEVERSEEGDRMDMRNIQVKSKFTKVSVNALGSSPSKGEWSLRGLHKGTFQRILMLAGSPLFVGEGSAVEEGL